MSASEALVSNLELQRLLVMALSRLEEAQEEARRSSKQVRDSLARAGSSEACGTSLSSERRGWEHASLFCAPDGSFPDPNVHALQMAPWSSKMPVASALGKFSTNETSALVRNVRQNVQELLTRKALHELQSKRGLTMEQLDNKMESIANFDMDSAEALEACEEVDWENVARNVRSSRSSGPHRTAEDCKLEWECACSPRYRHDPWTEEEDKRLLELSKREKGTNWVRIAEELGTRRRPVDCLKRFQMKFNVLPHRKQWTLEEDRRLIDAVTKFGKNDWRAVSDAVGTRTGAQCLQRWRRCSLKPGIKKGRWTTEEDDALRAAVDCIGPRYWSLIAQYVEGRSDTQCRERYVNVLTSERASGPWSQEEDVLLTEAVRKHGGGKWSLISKEIPGRTDSQCRRHWLFMESRMRGERGPKRRRSIPSKTDGKRNKRRASSCK